MDADENLSRSPSNATSDKSSGGDKAGEVSNAPGVSIGKDGEAGIPGLGGIGDASSSSSSVSSTPTSEGFEGWARVFFQGRNDRVAAQLYPTNSSTLARDSYLYIEVDPGATELRIYPSNEEKKLLVDPPIELKYFYAARVPGSNKGAALFLKEDDREYQRYIFRFEFRNDKVLQPAARMYQLNRCSKAAKNLERMNWMTRKPAKVKRQEDLDETIRAEEKKSQEIISAYIGTMEDLTREGLVAAESFVDLINSVVTEEGTTMWGRRPYGTSWGAGYEDVVVGEDDDEDSGSDWSLDETEGQYDDVDEETLASKKTGEKIEESFERVFEALKKRVEKA